MDYFCDLCDKTFKIKSKSKHHKSLAHTDFEKCIRIKNTIQNPDFFHIDEIFTNYISNYNKKFDFYLVKYDFNLVLDGT